MPRDRISEVLDSHPDRSPLLALDLAVVARRHGELTDSLTDASVFYAVKANPHPDVIGLLVSLGSSFDVASIGEVHTCLAAGASPDSLSFGNTVKKQRDITEAHDLGVRRFAFDSTSELDKIIASAPGSTAFCRILCDGFGAAWPLSRKFGCSPEIATSLLKEAAEAGLRTGLSFHVGSQQFDPTAWDRALALVADIRAELRVDGIELALVNLGGGLPGTYLESVPPTSEYAHAMSDALHHRLGPDLPEEVIVEPGRFLVADAGVLRTEVVTVGVKSTVDEHRWVYLDVGMFSGLAEVLDEAIRYRIVPAGGDGFDPDEPMGPVVLAGPTCDSADILYQGVDYMLPLSLAPGDRLDLLSVGAYSLTYSTIGFNGFPPLDVEVIPLDHPGVPRAGSSEPAGSVTTGPAAAPHPTTAPPEPSGTSTPPRGAGLPATPAPTATPLPADVVEHLVAEGTARRYPPGASIFAEGDPAGAALVVLEGTAEVSVDDRRPDSGTDATVIRRVGPGCLLGERSCLDGTPRLATATATGADPVVVAAVDPPTFVQLVADLPVLADHVAGEPVGPAGGPAFPDQPLRRGIPISRLARRILDRTRDDDWMDLSPGDLATELGVSRELLSRAIHHLAARGAVALERGRLHVQSEEVLAELAARTFPEGSPRR